MATRNRSMKAASRLAVIGLQLLSLVACAPGQPGSVSSLAAPIFNGQQPVTKSVTRVDETSAIRPFREDAREIEVSFQINDRDFARRLNDGGREPIVVQGGTVLPAGEKPKATGIYCGFKMKEGSSNAFADELVPYSVDRDSLKATESSKLKSIRFSLNDLISVECADPRTGRADELSTAEVREVVGHLLSISRMQVERIIPGPIGKKLDLLTSGNQAPSFSILFDLKAPANLKVSFQAIAFRMIGDKPDKIAPSHLAFVNRRTHELVTAWAPTGHSEAVVLPDSILTFQTELTQANQIKKVLSSLRDLALTVSIQGGPMPTPTYYIDLLEICEKYPDKIVDLVTGATGCPTSLPVN